MTRPTVLLLDIDGTLVDNTLEHIAAWREAFSTLGSSMDPGAGTEAELRQGGAQQVFGNLPALLEFLRKS